MRSSDISSTCERNNINVYIMETCHLPNTHLLFLL